MRPLAAVFEPISEIATLDDVAAARAPGVLEVHHLLAARADEQLHCARRRWPSLRRPNNSRPRGDIRKRCTKSNFVVRGAGSVVIVPTEGGNKSAIEGRGALSSGSTSRRP